MKNLRVNGSVAASREFSFADLRSLPGQVEDISALIPGRSGGAVRLTSVLDAVGLQPQADYITVTADDGEFSASVPLLAVAGALLCFREGESPLPREKGGPVRLLIPGAASCDLPGVDACANVKFLAEIQLGSGPGQDTRPGTPREHQALHETPGHEHLESE